MVMGFRHVQCQIDYLSTRRTGREVKEALKRLPDDLFATYAAALARVQQPDLEMARDALQWLAQTREPPTLFLLEICQGLISYNDPTSTVALAYPSVFTFPTSDYSKRDKSSVL